LPCYGPETVLLDEIAGHIEQVYRVHPAGGFQAGGLVGGQAVTMSRQLAVSFMVFLRDRSGIIGDDGGSGV
jgi:hypothetical protein